MRCPCSPLGGAGGGSACATRLVLHVLWPIDAEDDDVLTIDQLIPKWPEAQSFDDAERRRVLGVDDRDEAWHVEDSPGPVNRAASRFSGVSLPPRVASELPSDFQTGPALGVPQTAATEQHAVGFALDCPV